MAVFFGKNRILDRPANSDCRVIPSNAKFVGRIVVVSALVFYVGEFACNADAVREARRYIYLPKIIGR